MCARTPIDSTCFYDGCPWPTFLDDAEARKVLDAIDAGGGLRDRGGGKVVLPPEATGFRDGELLLELRKLDMRAATIAGVAGIDGPRDGRAIPPPAPPRPPALPDPRVVQCKGLIGDIGRMWNSAQSEYQTCKELAQRAALACQRDTDRDGRGDVCDP